MLIHREEEFSEKMFFVDLPTQYYYLNSEEAKRSASQYHGHKIELYGLNILQ